MQFRVQATATWQDKRTQRGQILVHQIHFPLQLSGVLDDPHAKAFDRFWLEMRDEVDVIVFGGLKNHRRGQRVVDIARDFLDTNGVTQSASAKVLAPDASKHPFQSGSAPTVDDLRQAVSDLPNAAQRGLVERFDASIGANTVLHPFGGATQSTPQEAMAAKLPVLGGETDVCTIMAYGFNPVVAQWSPGHGAVCAVVESLARLTAAGGNPARARLTLQEYFEKLGQDSSRWGKPLVALLGALDAQLEFGTAAIGGKDSMSGSFKDLDVPPTLVSFAIVPGKASQVVSAEFKQAGSTVVVVDVPRTSALLPDLKVARERLSAIHALVVAGKVRAAAAVRQGGIGHALVRMSFGNRLGVTLSAAPAADFLIPAYGSVVLEVASAADLGALPHRVLGQTNAEAKIAWPGASVAVAELLAEVERLLKAGKLYSSGIVEGLNLRINLCMRKAYGYRSFDLLQTSLYHTLGDLPEPKFAHRFC